MNLTGFKISLLRLQLKGIDRELDDLMRKREQIRDKIKDCEHCLKTDKNKAEAVRLRL